ncbi:MAG: non-homologous end joining protein Ku [Candidatus Aminicenantales bacterium]
MPTKKVKGSPKAQEPDEGRQAGARPSWRGMISFGLVNVPVNLYTAVKPELHEMNYLRKDDLCPIAYRKVCRLTGEEVPFKDIVRGYEYRDGDFVVLDDEDFRKADVKKSSTIDVAVFVDEKDVDPKYMERPYYLEPEKKAHKAYALFRDAMAASRKVAIGLFVLRDREHLVMLKSEGRAILLILLRFAASLRDARDLDLPAKADVPKNQMELALDLIKKFEGDFHPETFKDTYAARLRSIIAAKAKGKTVHVREEKAPRETEVEDLMSRLKESLSATRH